MTTTAAYRVDLAKHGLSRRDRAILDLERSWWKYPGAKATAIRELGYSVFVMRPGE